MTPTRSEFEHTPLWAAVASTLTALQASGELAIETGAPYVIDFFCRELAAKQVTTPESVRVAPGR